MNEDTRSSGGDNEYSLDYFFNYSYSDADKLLKHYNIHNSIKHKIINFIVFIICYQ